MRGEFKTLGQLIPELAQVAENSDPHVMQTPKA